MRAMPTDRTRLLYLVLAVVLAGARGSGQSGDFLVLDDTPRDVTNLNAEAVRPLALDPGDGDLYALNTHGSQVVRFAGSPIRERGRFDTPLFPIALAIHGQDLLVVCEGTRCVARLDRLDGSVRALLPLPSEPGDIVVDAGRNRAFVACPGTDVVVQVALDTFTITRSHAVRSKRPRFLSLEADGSLLVAPSVSGNNTAPINGRILDLGDPANSPGQGLPDVDLFRLRAGEILFRSALRGMGSLLFAHGRNPVTGEYWVLNVASFNSDPELPGERELRGRFAANRLSIATLPAGGTGALSRTIDLDDADPGTDVRYESEASVGQPFGLTFSSSGQAFVSAPNRDKVVLLGPEGSRRGELRLPPGSIPLATLLDERAQVAWVHAWGTNRVHGFRLRPSASEPFSEPFLELDLGSDPTPARVRAGRRIFYDASFSAAGRFTCAHCHPGGRADGLVWDLSSRPFDEKGPLVTQSLLGLESKFPYHWRGERSLGDFNAAFRELLGHATALPDETFADLETFLFSLQQSANPREDLTRRLVRRSGEGDPLVGQDIFVNLPADGGFSCNDCHQLPLGTTADPISEEFSLVSSRTHFDAPAFWDGSLEFKEQPVVSVSMPGFTTSLPVLGAGLGARGQTPTLEGFTMAFPGIDSGPVLAFLRQLDHGLAPAAQAAWLFEADSPTTTPQAIESILTEQAARGWIDVVAWGSTSPGQASEGTAALPARWLYDPGSERFLSGESRIPDRTWPEFELDVRAGRTRVVVQGLPPGNGRTFGHARAHALAPRKGSSDSRGLPPPPPLFRVQPRVLWSNAAVAKITFETSVPTGWEIHYGTPAGGRRVARSREPARVHTAVLQDLEPSTRDLVTFFYQGDLTVFDAAGRSASVPLPGFATSPMIAAAQSLLSVVGEAEWEASDWNADERSLRARARFQLQRKPGGALRLPAADHLVVARLIVDGRVHSAVTSPGPSAFLVSDEPYDALPGPFLLSTPSRVEGAATDGSVLLEFEATALEPGSSLVLQIVAIPPIDPEVFDPAAPNFNGAFAFGWSMPDTPPGLRQLELVLPGESGWHRKHAPLAALPSGALVER